ncbi:MAG: 50S ribosomal protein L13 [Candidatus Hydrogenedentota bacterium]|nr:MAG: 50S ribosomal protein L13 [Candidatus Hydrogenedentota bacterium]
MVSRKQKTTIPSKASAKAGRKWTVIDAAGKPLGKVAALAASRLRGKHRADFTPHLDTGDFVVVTNAAEVRLSGRKAEQKFYRRHSGHPGGLKSVPYGELLRERPEKLIELAVRRMLPKNRLGRRLFTKLKVYAGPDHPHKAQKPERVEVTL